MSRRRADDGVSRMPVLFATVGVLIVSSIVSLVLVTSGDDSGGADRAAAAGTPTTAPSTSTSAPARSGGDPTPAPSTSPVARVSPVPTDGTAATRKAITYTVKPGDNLTVIAAWFKLRGYGDLYTANRAVIGDDPNLIRPGQKITVSSAGMSVTR